MLGKAPCHQWSTMTELGSGLPTWGHRLTADGMPEEIAGEVAEMMQPADRQCSICKEVFTEPEFARRCEAQGFPPMPYHVGDVLRLKKAKHLLLITSTMVHHALGVICPINGPCEHARRYSAYRLSPTVFGDRLAWMASCEMLTLPAERGRRPIAPRRVEVPSPVGVRGGMHERLCGLTHNWGVVPEDGDPELYMMGPYVGEDWQKLWDLYYQWTSRRARGLQKRLPGLRVAR